MMFYAERMGDPERGEPYIAERGIFLDIAEFIPYRRDGWEATVENNAKADQAIRVMEMGREQ